VNVVIDASVLIKFYVPEVFSDKASDLLDAVKQGDISLFAPDLIFPEAGNILWKKHCLKELSESEVNEITDTIVLLPIRGESSKTLLPLATGIAMTYGITVYDAMYLALARIRETLMITADRKLFKRMTETEMDKHVSWLGNFQKTIS
jgi:predicted nucleic acid-binding protein